MNPFNQYKAAAIQSTSPLEQVAILLDTAASHIVTAQESLEKGDFEGRFFATERACTILYGLSSIISKKNSGTEAFLNHTEEFFQKTIYAIYEINIQNDSALCFSVIESLQDMAGAWRHAALEEKLTNAKQRQSPARSQAAPSMGEGIMV